MSRLTPCPQCHRHVRLDESSCPFCSSQLPRVAATRSLPTAGLKRAALFALTATVASTACGGDDDGSSGDAQQQQQQNPTSPSSTQSASAPSNPTSPGQPSGGGDPTGPGNPSEPTTPAAPSGTSIPSSGSPEPESPSPGRPGATSPGVIMPPGPSDVPTAVALYGAVPAPIDEQPSGGGASNNPFQPEMTDEEGEDDGGGSVEKDAGAAIDPEGPPLVQPLYGAPAAFD